MSEDRTGPASGVADAAKAGLPEDLRRLEAESILILREVTAERANPVLLYSIGKDSAVLLHLAMKALYPGKPPFPLLHIDTTWKFREMIAFRDAEAKRLGLELLVHTNLEGVAAGVGPFTHGSAVHTEVMKTQALKQALDRYGFDAAFGGAGHAWDPRQQRPELWRLYNTRIHKGESLRAFPLSNWTELDVWRYIQLESIPLPSLYFAKLRPVVERDGALIMVDDARLPLAAGETPAERMVRFRTLGCYPLTGAVESHATTLDAVIAEMQASRHSERQGRVIDRDGSTMESKKQDGYF